ncbi:hypothetical protein [Phaeobacter inhibens]|uniref:hypothetical protein n=1 Tax=Phaeobacter inhibens TaxID=221822 RepID=UPI000F47BC91|nr:hypothetical protein [Phaeobacter inhibens]
MKNNDDGVTITIPKGHAPIAAQLLWEALCLTIAEVGRNSSDETWKQELYEQIQARFGEQQAMFAALSSVNVPTSMFPEGMQDLSAAMRTGMTAIDAAFDRVRDNRDWGG